MRRFARELGADLAKIEGSGAKHRLTADDVKAYVKRILTAPPQATPAALPKVPVTRDANGPGTIETYSVRYDWPATTGVIIGRLDADGSRFMALTEDDDLVALMSDGDPIGARIAAKSTEDGVNRATLA